MADPLIETTLDDFLGGKLKLRQPTRGHRAGHDAILLAASTEARAGDVVVDFGAGVGTAGLALACRAGGIELTLVEIDSELAALAALNAKANGIPARIVAADVTAPDALSDLKPADRVLMNPPFHVDTRHRPSPDAARRNAHSATKDTLEKWIDAAHRLLKTRGVLTLIWRADDLPHVLQVVGAKFGSIEVQPVHGVRDKPAIRVLLRAVKGGRAAFVLVAPILVDGTDQVVEIAMSGRGTLFLARGS